MENKLEIEYDIVVRMPPKKRYTVQVKSVVVRKGEIKPIVPEEV